MSRRSKSVCRERYAGVPDDFEIRMVGRDLELEGITRNQRLRKLEGKELPVAELLTEVAKQMNPLGNRVELSEDRQKVVWTVGVDPRDPDRRKLILITTRRAAEQRGYRLPAVFLPKDQRGEALKISAARLQRKPRRQP